MPLEPLYRFTNLLLIENMDIPFAARFSETIIFPASIPCNDSSKFVSSFWQLLKAIVVELCAPWLSDPVIPLTSVRTVSSTSNSSLNCFSLVGAFFIESITPRIFLVIWAAAVASAITADILPITSVMLVVRTVVGPSSKLEELGVLKFKRRSKVLHRIVCTQHRLAAPSTYYTC
jgi:hypothetical protein